MRTKRMNNYSKNEDGSVNIHLNETDVAVIDIEDVIRCKPVTVTKRMSNKYAYPMISQNKRQAGGKYKTTHVTLGKFLTGAEVTKYKDKNPFNCRRSNLISKNTGKKNGRD